MRNHSSDFKKELLQQKSWIRMGIAGIVLCGTVITYAVFNGSDGSKQQRMRINELEKRNAQIEAEGSAYLSKIKHQNDRILDLKDDVLRLEKKLNLKEAELTTHDQTLDMKQGSIRSLESRISELKDDKYRMQRNIDENNRVIQEMSQRSKEQNELLKQTQNQLKDVQAQLERIQAKHLAALKDQKLAEQSEIAAQEALRNQKTLYSNLMQELATTRANLNTATLQANDKDLQLQLAQQKELQQQQLQYKEKELQTQANTDLYKLISVTSIVLVIALIIFVVFALQKSDNDFILFSRSQRKDEVT
ncbi:hypothetical protein MY04_3594 [Flammeovirga sp. MY04]|uniref:hypothetical protein n=1 Tax=Flammeovirga sp. MY04 TaxID=1191459 RepID=UPI00080634D1|nr:hypothetical protein [Flammeovirga sp. MY04]ANQ50942.1 hypothetical protein MY04_3594 [Flammeovirga sp. MY04]